MLLFGMTGPIGHGKSTLAKALKEIEPQSVHLESSAIISEVANAMQSTLHTIPAEGDIAAVNNWLRSLPAVLLQIVHAHCNFEQIQIDPKLVELHPVEYEKLFLHLKNLRTNSQLMRDQITRENKESYRPFLQWLGGYLVTHVDATLWYKEIIRRAYDAESQGCKLCIVGGLRFPADAALIRQAGGFVFKVYRPGHLQNDILDPTERERDNIQVDSTIVSNGSVADVAACAAAVYQDAQNNDLRSVYETLDYHQEAPVAPAVPA